jgi:hypothetical protein
MGGSTLESDGKSSFFEMLSAALFSCPSISQICSLIQTFFSYPNLDVSTTYYSEIIPVPVVSSVSIDESTQTYKQFTSLLPAYSGSDQVDEELGQCLVYLHRY